VSADGTIDLLRRARAGDGEALNELLVREIPELRRWASRRLPAWARDAVDTSDLVQETVMHTLRHLEHFEARGDGALQAYLRQAIVNRVRNAVRNASTRPALEPLDSGAIDEGTSPLDRMIGLQLHDRYEAALARLSNDEREGIVGRLELGLTYAELARAMGKPTPDAARMLVVRALVKLATEMA
jgi:RNA polymerase sigma-70 factor (ECF subfamily)